MNQYHVLSKGSDIKATKSDSIKESYIKDGYILKHTIEAESEEDALNGNTPQKSAEPTPVMAHGYSTPVLETSDGIAMLLTFFAVLGFIGSGFLFLQGSIALGVNVVFGSLLVLAVSRVLSRLLDISNSLKISNSK
jgi:hypothetical protein